MKTKTLSEAQWNQCRAALRFWLEVAEHSRKHPSRHPGVAEMFANHGPLSAEDIEDLIREGAGDCGFTTPTRAAASVQGVGASRLQKALDYFEVEPVCVIGAGKVYRQEDVDRILRRLPRAT